MKTGTRYAILLTVCMSIVGLNYDDCHAGVREHDRGFYLRLTAGGGRMQSETDRSAIRFEGTAIDASVAIGGIVSRNNALHFTLWGLRVSEPDVEIDGQPVAAGKLGLRLTALGAGLTHYFMPINLYVSGSLGVGRGSGERGILEHEAEPGLVLDVSVGKEWWAGDKWGLGLAAAFGLHSVDDEDLHEPWKGGSLTLRFSATYN